MPSSVMSSQCDRLCGEHSGTESVEQAVACSYNKSQVDTHQDLQARAVDGELDECSICDLSRRPKVCDCTMIRSQ